MNPKDRGTDQSGHCEKETEEPEMEFEEQRVKDIKTNNKKFLWYIKDRKDCERLGRSPGHTALYPGAVNCRVSSALCEGSFQTDPSLLCVPKVHAIPSQLTTRSRNYV